MGMKNHPGRLMAAALFLTCGAMLLPAVAPGDSIVTDWNELVVAGALADATAPTVSTHFMSTVYTAAYDAWAAFDEQAVGVATGNLLRELAPPATNSGKERAVSHAIYTVLSRMAPSRQADYDALMDALGYAAHDGHPAADVGRRAAEAVIRMRMNDGSNAANGYANARVAYQPATAPRVPGRWQPAVLPNGNVQKPLTPHWGSVSPFALRSGSAFRPPPPPAPGTPAWNNQIESIILFSGNLTNRQKAVVEYWLPLLGTPPILLASMSSYVSRRDGYTLDEDVKLFFVIHNAMFDAGICSWEAKYHYDYERPISAIRALGDREIEAWGGPGRGTVTMPASEWMPYQFPDYPTPPFPEYTSGHSTFSTAWAEVMRLFTGSDSFGFTVEVDRLEIEGVDLNPPVVLHFPTFTSASAGAEGSGQSRIYGGIHWMVGNVQGIESGAGVGRAVWERAQSFFDGSASPAYPAVSGIVSSAWTPHTIPSFDAPSFTRAPGWIGFGIDEPGNCFGFWQTDVLDPLAVGEYRLRLHLQAERLAGARAPELRIRLLQADNRVSALMGVADTLPNLPYPETVDLRFASDGATPFRVAVDVLSFTEDQQGTIYVTNAELLRVD